MNRCYICNSPKPKHKIKGLVPSMTLYLCEEHSNKVREYMAMERARNYNQNNEALNGRR